MKRLPWKGQGLTPKPLAPRTPGPHPQSSAAPWSPSLRAPRPLGPPASELPGTPRPPAPELPGPSGPQTSAPRAPQPQNPLVHQPPAPDPPVLGPDPGRGSEDQETSHARREGPPQRAAHSAGPMQVARNPAPRFRHCPGQPSEKANLHTLCPLITSAPTVARPPNAEG